MRLFIEFLLDLYLNFSKIYIYILKALFNQSLYNEKVIKEVEMPFCNDKTAFPDKPSGKKIFVIAHAE